MTDQGPKDRCYINCTERVLIAQNYFMQEVDAGQPPCDVSKVHSVAEAYGNPGVIKQLRSNCS
jgi:hypothetical protein